MSPFDDHPPGKSDDDVVAAAEYALGLTAAPERERAAQRATREEGFAREVIYWQRQAALSARETQDTVPPERVWRAIQEQVAGSRDRNDSAPVPGRAPTRRSTGFWHWATMATGAIATAAVIALVLVIGSPQPEPLIATLQSEQGLDFVLVVQPDRTGSSPVQCGTRTARAGCPSSGFWLPALNRSASA